VGDQGLIKNYNGNDYLGEKIYIREILKYFFEKWVVRYKME
jgi:hypothetical protein